LHISQGDPKLENPDIDALKISVNQQPLYQKLLLKQSRKTNLTDFDLRCMLLSYKYEKENEI
jgi:hypothetical protein